MTRTEGPIAAPEALLATLAEYRQLHVLFADVDPRHEWILRVAGPPELDLDAVAQVERDLEAELSDALLAVLACQVPHLEDHYDLTLRQIAAHTEAAWSRGCPRDQVAVARTQDAFYCLPRRMRAWASTAIATWADRTLSVPRPLDRWIADEPMGGLWDMLCDFDLVDPDAHEPVPAHARPDAAPALVPRLVRPVAAAAAVARRVQHPKFGAGRVLQEVGDGDARKLVIDFGAPHGVRTLVARFVTELPPDR
ncbi:hypothetical protein [Nannocystis punicea]|uniref:Uncharacterized protein n=1 Tax=Nannocystis punicea TaxID=2995304 RepID=A0ABY7GW52_9BACT|nr:hypothetical protein [Nannocystis poenicansa]WAS91135.1 hypothetical protein O0S08_33530 [Nannocystis poenicansa]